MKTIYIALLLISYFSFSQNKKDWFFGTEIGNNTITSSNLSNKNSFQGGFLTEYYFANHWSVIARLKYFKTSTTNNAQTGYFDGAVISIPLNLKWEYRITNKLKGNLIMGLALNKEVKNDYYYTPNEKTDYATFFGTFNTGFGFSYFLNNRTALFTNYEVYVLGNSKDNQNSLNILPNSTNNNLFNVGIKHNFKK